MAAQPPIVTSAVDGETTGHQPSREAVRTTSRIVTPGSTRMMPRAGSQARIWRMDVTSMTRPPVFRAASV
jgi:hypothetical protein